MPRPICTRTPCANDSRGNENDDDDVVVVVVVIIVVVRRTDRASRHEARPVRTRERTTSSTCTCLSLRITRFTAWSTTIDVYTHDGCARVLTHACTNARAYACTHTHVRARVHTVGREIGRYWTTGHAGRERATRALWTIVCAHTLSRGLREKEREGEG